MPANKTVWEYVADNVESTLAGITQAAGYANNVVVKREKKLGQGPDAVNPADRFIMMVPGELIPRIGPEPARMSPVCKDDYDQIFWLDCYGFESKTGGMTPDAVGYSIAGDAKKALESDSTYQRGTHPVTGIPLAINTQVIFAQPLELGQSQYRGTVLRVVVWTRTAKFDPFNQ